MGVLHLEQHTQWNLFQIHKELDQELPVAETAAKQVLSLPVHPALSEDNLIKVVSEVRTLCD